MKEVVISAYWEGYPENNVTPFPLDEISSQAAIVPIAFIAPASVGEDGQSTTWEWGIGAKSHEPSQIKAWITDIKKNNPSQKVLFSLLDTPQTHWNDVDKSEFARNLVSAMNEMGVDGVDIDAESGMESGKVFSQNFIDLITAIRKQLGSERPITYTCYMESDDDTTILNAVGDKIDIVQTMAYWNDLEGMKQLFEHYGNIVGNNKISVGVKAGGGDGTTLATVQDTAAWLAASGYNKMMLWSATRDVKAITGYTDGTFMQTIYSGLTQTLETEIQPLFMGGVTTVVKDLEEPKPEQAVPTKNQCVLF